MQHAERIGEGRVGRLASQGNQFCTGKKEAKP